MKKNDIILIVAILLIAMIGMFFINKAKAPGDKVVIKVVDEVYKELPLNKDITLTIEGINGSNVLEIKDGYADVISATCKDELCVHQKPISLNGEKITCLPNKVVIYVESIKESQVDAISN